MAASRTGLAPMATAAAVRAAPRRAASSIRGGRRGSRAARTRSRQRDLLIEHLHLSRIATVISRPRICRARRRDEACARRSLRGRDLLRPFRRGEGRRGRAAAGHGAGLRFAVLRHARRRGPAARSSRQLGREVRVVRAPCMGACDRRRWCAVGHMQVFGATPDTIASIAKRRRIRMPSQPRTIWRATARMAVTRCSPIACPASAPATT